jgi:hypothetical protein
MCVPDVRRVRTTATANVPAINEATAAIASAGPARIADAAARDDG